MTAKRHEITVDTLLVDLESDRQLARQEGQSAAAVSATMAKARLLGLVVDRKESGQPGDFGNLQTVEEVLELVRKEVGDDAARALASLLDRRSVEPTHTATDTIN